MKTCTREQGTAGLKAPTDYDRLTPALSLGTLKPFLGSRKPLNSDPLMVDFDDLPLKPRMEFVDSCEQEERRVVTKRLRR